MINITFFGLQIYGFLSSRKNICRTIFKKNKLLSSLTLKRANFVDLERHRSTES